MAMTTRRKLLEWEVHNALVKTSRKMTKLSDQKLQELDKESEEWGQWVLEALTAMEITEQYEQKKLSMFVHKFLNKYPLLLAATKEDVAMAFMKETRNRLRERSLTEAMFEEDENGEPWCVYVGDGYYKRNPKFKSA